METNKRIVYSHEDISLTVETVMNKLRAFQYNDQYKMLGESFMKCLDEWERVIRERRADPLTVVVIGDFKRGKSSFINALLNEDAAPVNVTPETVILNRIRYGSPQNEAILPGHKRMLLSDDELKRENFLHVMKEADNQIKWLELKRPCEILKKISIIDTPGLDDAMHNYTDMVEEAILNADVIIYVYNIKYPLSLDEQMFLKFSVLTQKYTKLFLVGNYADTLENEDDYRRVGEMIKDRLKGLLPDTEVIMISALDERCRQLSAKRPNEKMERVLEAAFEKVRGDLDKLIEEKEETVIADRIQRLAGAMINRLYSELDAVSRGLFIDKEEVSELVKNLEKEKDGEEKHLMEIMKDIDKTSAMMKGQAVKWMDEFMEKIETDAVSLSCISSEDLRKYYSFYCTDLLQEAIQTCIEHHKEEMFEKLEKISGNTAQKLAGSFITGDTLHFNINLDNRIWTKGDTVGLAVSIMPAMGSGLIGKVMSIGANTIAGTMRQKEVSSRAPELVEQIKYGFTELEISVQNTLDVLYKRLAGSAKKIMSETVNEDVERMEHLLGETIKAASLEEESKKEMVELIGKARLLLSDCELLLQF